MAQTINNSQISFKTTYGINSPLEIRLQSISSPQSVGFTSDSGISSVNDSVIVNRVVDLTITSVVEAGIPSKGALVPLGTLDAGFAPNNLIIIVSPITSPIVTTINAQIDSTGVISVVPAGGDYGFPAAATVVIHTVYVN